MFSYEKEFCTGCSACAEVCPTKSISIGCNEGYFYPAFDFKLCIDCDQCIQSCNYRNGLGGLVKTPLKTYAVHHKKADVRKTSRSGGVFIAIAEYFLEYGGIVYGCVINDDLEVKHVRADSKDSINLMKGSKYLQSNLKGVFSSVLSDLKNDKKILFVGTPCQVAGLRNYLSIKYKKSLDNILFCDLLCHGVPSKRIFEDYIKYVNERTGGRISSFSFRDKTFGWKSSIESFTLKTGEKYFSNIYSNLYNSNCALRPSCYHCSYARVERVGDVSIGDFWVGKQDRKRYGLEKFCDSLGTSVVFVNTSKGAEAFDAIRDSIDCVDVSTMNYSQPALSSSVNKPDNTSEFWNVYNANGFEAAYKFLFCNVHTPKSFKSSIKSCARKTYIKLFGKARWFCVK